MSHPRRRLEIGLLVVALAVASGAALIAQASGTQRGFLWKVERDGRVGWLVGSLHLLTPDAYPLPPSLSQAFATTDTLIEEADPTELESPQFAAAVMSKALYSNGQTLETHVSRDTFQLVAQHVAKVGLPIEAVQRMKPWMIALTLQGLTLRRAGFDAELGIDRFFHREATRASKRFKALETGLEQVEYLDRLGNEAPDAMLRENLENADTEVTQARQLTQSWRAGDAAALERMLVDGMKDAPGVYQTLVVERNRRWLPQLTSCFQTARCFVVVGAAHVVGTDGLVTLLRAQGYAVQQQ